MILQRAESLLDTNNFLINSRKIILASQSKRRIELINLLGFKDIVYKNHKVDEEDFKWRKPYSKSVLDLSELKARSIKTTNNENSVVIAGDTMVIRAGKIFHKTSSLSKIKSYLQTLSGRKHFVLGGICVIAPNGNISKRVVKTEVFFKKIGKKDLHDQYLLEEGRNKAGGYAIQGYASCLVSKIKGSYSNVVGLSIYHLLLMLKGLGWSR